MQVLQSLLNPALRLAIGCTLSTAAIAAPISFVAAQGAVLPAARGTLSGTVLNDASNKPVPNAEIVIPALKVRVISDSVGNFDVAELPAGLHTITISANGFMPFSTRLSFAAGQRIESDFALRPALATQVTGVETRNAPSAGYFADFESRRSSGVGRFITQDVFEEANGRKLADIIKQRIPGVQIITNNGQRSVATGSRGLQSFSNTPGARGAKTECYAQVVMDGIIAYSSTRGERPFDLDRVDPSLVSAVEFYTVSQTPSQFNGTGTAPCGTLVIWSRR